YTGTITPNQPPAKPVISGTTYRSTFTNITQQFTATSSDPEATDSLTFKWDWGDGNITVGPPRPATGTVTDTATYSWPIPGNYTVSASAPLHNTSSQSGVVVTASTTKWVNFTLGFTAGWIAGTVVNDADGSPLASIGITVLSGSTSITATSTNASGQYKVSVA